MGATDARPAFPLPAAWLDRGWQAEFSRTHPKPVKCASRDAWGQSSGRRARCRGSNNRFGKPGAISYRLRALWTCPSGRGRLMVGVHGVAGSCAPPAHGRSFLSPASWLGTVASGMFPRKTDDVTVVLPEPPGASLRDGGPAVVAQITGLANQGQARDVCELCGSVRGSREGLVVGMRGVAGSCGPPTHGRPSHYRLCGWTRGGRQNSPERPMT